MKNFYSVNELISIIGEGVISKATVYNQIRNGKIPVAYFGCRALIPAYWVEQFVAANRCKQEV
ncbi:MAG: helix-turn-helix domain-containing protein [Intestinibacter sp.]|uniref:helix-turn-helix domain-containing protein n=1 Tax=Intestinibacter sp. TaxID=1965304 RepID=UPI003F1492FF